MKLPTAFKHSPWLLVLAAVVVGCQHDAANKAALAALSEGCLVNSDCASPLACAFQRCHVECVTTRDCDGTLHCVGAHVETRVCQLDSEATCTTSVDCLAGFLCGQDGTCRDHCASDAECGGGQVCTHGVCAEPSELDANGNLPEVLGFTTCRLNSDCSAGSSCLAGVCQPQCMTDRDCDASSTCVNGGCQAVTVASCQSDRDCTQAGQTCSGGQCACACHADVDCAGGSTCDGCACHAPRPPECTANTDCHANQQCAAGKCVCQCVTDRDCAQGLVCDGCGCTAAPPVTQVADASVSTPSDLALLAGIDDVQGRLTITGSTLTSTAGLESVHSVGELMINNLTGVDASADSPPALAGLANLTLIRGDLTIQYSSIKSLSFNPELKIEGNVMIQWLSNVNCRALAPFQAHLVAAGFTGTFRALYDGGCQGACVASNCVPSG